MRLKAIVCEVLAREIYACAVGTAHVVDVELLEKGLHTEPAELGAELQRRVDSTDPDRYDAIVLAYGLCGAATAGIRARHIPIIIPRAHDCITLYLGSKERYHTRFTEHPGTYYYTPDYMERGGADSVSGLGAEDDGKTRSQYEEYVLKYGEENALYLMEVMGAWRAHYDQATYIDIADINLPDYRAKVKDLAARRGWSYSEVVGQARLLQQLVDGDWTEDAFLRVEPGELIVATYGNDIMRAEEPSSEVVATEPNRF